ncbi:TIR domain-containing protein [Lysobacter sp. CFH 32150]|uniref:TIR domain-containing protein n=1 Tax=Lysobacter sp. CFH 32150 TaxID=2927128 RepID=UPI001FA6CD17|nr:TIR domain-containing protein [Lysobacter sp. CFH 32150]
MRYRAFLSYSHADAHWARWLLRRLEGYRVPSRLVGTPGIDGPIPARLGAMFRDRDELPSAGDLSTTIRSALDDSATLVVICSPAAAQSQWVNAEVEAFRSSGRGARVLCFVVAGDPTSRGSGKHDPALGCFPPALLQADANGVQREPLAADARREGDGRERAFLKLVAGLLGVGYDTLAQREAQRRNRKLVMVAAASLAGMAIALALAATAYVARNDAQRRQAQAEDILGFMLGDLREKLTTVGRLDLMRAVDNKATTYFATLDPRDLSDRALEEQARSLTGIGQVRLDEGSHDAAMTAFREAHARSTALRERQPANGQRLFDLAQAEYWIGYVALQQGRYDDAEAWLRKYRDSAIALAAMDRDNFGWQKEVAYGHQNLAVMDEKRGRYAKAEEAMREVLALYRIWTRQRPTDTALQFEAANATSWLGTLAMRQGKLRDAEALFAEEVRGIAGNRSAEPRNARWKKESAEALALLADAQTQRGRWTEARASVRDAGALTEALSRQDPSNRKWQVSLGLCRLWQAQLDAGPAPAAAATNAHAAETLLAAAHAAEPKDQRVQRGLADAHNLLAQLALARGDAATARAQLARARALLEPEGQTQPGPLNITHVNTLLLEGEAAQLAGDDTVAAASWNRARQLLLANAADPLPFVRLDPLVRALRHLGDNDQAQRYHQRLDAAGYVPLRPWPASTAVATR